VLAAIRATEEFAGEEVSRETQNAPGAPIPG
jgi:hypothetical protein